MPKYYVESGDLRRVQDAATPHDAVVAALTRETEEKENITIGIFMGVNEIGFGFNPCADCERDYAEEIENETFCSGCSDKEAVDNSSFFSTETVIQMAGLASVFKLKKNDGELVDLEQENSEDES